MHRLTAGLEWHIHRQAEWQQNLKIPMLVD